MCLERKVSRRGVVPTADTIQMQAGTRICDVPGHDYKFHFPHVLALGIMQSGTGGESGGPKSETSGRDFYEPFFSFTSLPPFFLKNQLPGEEARMSMWSFFDILARKFHDRTDDVELTSAFLETDQALSVVGVMIDVSSLHTASPFFTSVLSAVDRIPNGGDVAQTGPLLSSEIVELVGASDVFQYNGSLTTPPCTEGVAWNVVRRPLYVSADVYSTAKAVLKFNSRYTQTAPGERNLLHDAIGTMER